MDKKFAAVLLAIGLGVFSLPVWQTLWHFSSRLLALETALWFLAILGVAFAAFQKRRRGQVRSRATDPVSTSAGILVATFALWLGGSIASPAWLVFGWSLAFGCLLVLLLGLDRRTLIQLGTLSLLAPWVFWQYGSEIHWFGQKLASGLAGSILDLAKIFYYNKGAVIGLVSVDFLQVDDCAGLRLLWPCLFAVTVYGFVRNYSLICSLYLFVQTLFWVVVFNALRIAYRVWIQDGEGSMVESNALLLDAICAIGIVFFTWSGEQFYLAFAYQEKDHDPDEQARVEGDVDSANTQPALSNRFGSWFVSYAVLFGLIAFGGWLLIKGRSAPEGRYNAREIAEAIGSLRMDLVDTQPWEISESSELYEAINPVFKQTDVWPQRQWVFSRKEGSDGESRMRLRVDGVWYHSPRADWMWKWFGWKIQRPQQEQDGLLHWQMTRSIVEEGFVVSSEVGLGSSQIAGSPRIRVSLVHEGFKAMEEADRLKQQEFFRRLLESINKQVQAGTANSIQAPEAL